MSEMTLLSPQWLIEEAASGEFLLDGIADPPCCGKSHLNVMLVEDDDADAFLILEALSQCPHVAEVVTATDGIDAIEKLEQGSGIDIIVLDLAMPKMGGLDFLHELGKRGDDMPPVIVMTSSRVAEDAYRSYRRGAWLAVSKPRHAANYVKFFNETFGKLVGTKGNKPWRHRHLRLRFLTPT